MTLTFQDVLNEAKKLSTKLKDNDAAADAIASQMQAVYMQVEAMKQYSEDTAQLNDLAAERPRMALVAGIQQESKHIMDLQQENRELRGALEEQQNAIDLIMTKYRLHVSKLTKCQLLEQQLLKVIDSNTKTLETNADKVNEMKFVINQAIQLDDEAAAKEEEILSRLWTENKGLRELLHISQKYGSSGCHYPGLNVAMEDKEIQTDCNSFESLTPSPISVEYAPPMKTLHSASDTKELPSTNSSDSNTQES